MEAEGGDVPEQEKRCAAAAAKAKPKRKRNERRATDAWCAAVHDASSMTPTYDIDTFANDYC
jgi:hypothetical protein